MGEPNEALAALIAEADARVGCSFAGLARRVNDLGAERGLTLRYDYTSVYRWVKRGETPRDPVPTLLAQALSDKLGRRVRPSEFGMPEEPPLAAGGSAGSPARRAAGGPDELGLSAPWTHRGTVDVSVALSGSGVLVKRRNFGFLFGAALTAPAHQWLVQEPGRLAAALGGDRVTPELADRLPPMIAELRRMDDVSGEDVVLGLAEREFGWVAGLLDRASYDEPTARKLHLALAELGQFTGYVAYDAGLHALAQRYWIAALRAAHTADDSALGAYILSWMANQATSLDRPEDAVTLIETALVGTRGRQTPALLATLHSRQAYAQATLQSGSGCANAVAKAGSCAEQIRPEDEPSRLYWVNQVGITARIGAAFLRLGRAEQAVGPLAEGVRQLDRSMLRDRQLFLTYWAEALAQPGQQQDLEEAANRGLEAVILAEGLGSTLATQRVRDLCTQMKPHAMVPTVRGFLERARAVVA